MIVVMEQDIRKHNGNRWAWRPLLFRGHWQGKRTWRVGWGFWTISYYPSSGLKEFFDHIESGATEWRNR